MLSQIKNDCYNLYGLYKKIEKKILITIYYCNITNYDEPFYKKNALLAKLTMSITARTLYLPAYTQQFIKKKNNVAIAELNRLF